ncbi:MAG: rhomboid family intramembrane serine protease, partial [Acidobacteria bacterium]|nr:rhomboid family intramembrane serine protease [Acidobacteriota bacterium]
MIPLRDENPSRGFPYVTLLLIGSNVAIFLYEISLSPRALGRFVLSYGAIPAAVLSGVRAFPDGSALPWVTLLTSMFLHGGIMHLVGNMWFLWVFGDNVEDRMGHFRYLVFYLICGVGAGLAHALLNLNSAIPAVGASGAISGVLGAYMVMFPGTRVVTLVPLIVFFFTVQIPAVVML